MTWTRQPRPDQETADRVRPCLEIRADRFSRLGRRLSKSVKPWLINLASRCVQDFLRRRSAQRPNF